MLYEVITIGEYVLKTIESLKSQTYKNFEVIFINNCSTDNSLEIIKEQLKTVAFSYKIINRTRNEGPSSARNIGITDVLRRAGAVDVDVHLRRVRDELPLHDRITSYNVCYTKLLRWREERAHANRVWQYGA